MLCNRFCMHPGFTPVCVIACVQLRGGEGRGEERRGSSVDHSGRGIRAVSCVTILCPFGVQLRGLSGSGGRASLSFVTVIAVETADPQ